MSGWKKSNRIQIEKNHYGLYFNYLIILYLKINIMSLFGDLER